ncbi:MAG TPA: hypothetical protein VGC91_10740 [Pyrinomonadaceae bacterium]
MLALPLICRLLTQALSLAALYPHADAWGYTLSHADAGSFEFRGLTRTDGI